VADDGVILLDVDNALLDNDRIAADLGVHRTIGDLIGHDLSDFFPPSRPYPPRP
jgi:hypothetical protein